MSKFTGKSDFYDWVFMHNSPEAFLKEGEVWIGTGSGDVKLEIKDEKDLFLFGTHVVRSMNKTEGKQVIVLCDKSQIDYEELDCVSTYIKHAIDFLKKFEREHKNENPAEPLFKHLSELFTYESNITFEKLIKACLIHTDEGNYKIIPDLIKVPSYVLKNERFIVHYLIPKYFYWIHTKMATDKRLRFLEEAKEKYGLVPTDEVMFSGNILQSMQYKIDDFSEAEEND